MRKSLFFVMALALGLSSVYAGGIVHNTNQSASFIRNPSRGASLTVDAAYYNPAGLAFLEDGLHFGLNNQSIIQERRIESNFQGMNRNEFIGSVSAPLFPSFYGVYKKDRLALALSVNPIGGGGSALFEDGLPSFEMMVAALPPQLSAAGIPTSEYRMDMEFDGQSLIWGFQAGAAYSINDQIAVSAGVRYLSSSNQYTGFLRNIQINPLHPANPQGTLTSAPAFFTTLSTLATGAATGMQPIIDLGGGGFTLEQLLTAGMIDANTYAMLVGGLGGLYDPEWTAQQVQGAYILLAQQMTGLAQATGDMELDVAQKGSGIVPVIGFSLKLSENFVLGFKYEHRAAITLKNETTRDDTGMYPDGAEVPSDMPSMFSLGAQLGVMPNFRISGTFHYYLDKNAKYGKMLEGEYVYNDKVMDNNFFEAAFGLEYDITHRLTASLGYLRTQTGVKEIYHSDLSHSLSTNSLGLGVRFALNDMVAVNLGGMNTWYIQDIRNFTGYKETYNRSASVFAIGIDLKI